MTDTSPLIPGTLFIFKLGFVFFAALYFLFSLIIIRQVILMAETVKTEFGILLKLLSFLFALLSLGLLIYFVTRL